MEIKSGSGTIKGVSTVDMPVRQQESSTSSEAPATSTCKVDVIGGIASTTFTISGIAGTALGVWPMIAMAALGAVGVKETLCLKTPKGGGVTLGNGR